ncbi:MAG: hypothetical protein GVY16_08180 [Planctomycetes bacterium]|nr:hypothetical protein [Planctomycetota bacterium]
MALVLAWMFGMTMQTGDIADAEAIRLMRNLAIASVAMLGLTLIALVGVVLRWIRSSMGLQKPLPQSHYVDAWSEAGKRMRAPPADDAIDIRDDDDAWRDEEDDLYGREDDDDDEPSGSSRQ